MNKLTSDFVQSEYATQISQKIKLIQGDIIMKRNHNENIAFLKMVIRAMENKITNGLDKCENVKGFEQLKTECEKWIELISQKMGDSSI